MIAPDLGSSKAMLAIRGLLMRFVG